MKRGFYLALEGIEGAGKSTVGQLVAAMARDEGIETVSVREPGGTETGECIRSVLLGGAGSIDPWTEALLFSAARAQLAAEVVAPALRQGKWVITDRSVYSSLAYQGGGRRLGVCEVRAVNEPGLGEAWPDLVALLRLPAAVGVSRQSSPDRIGAEGVGFMEIVAATFDKLAAEDRDRFAVVDATMSVEDVAARVWNAVKGRYES